MVGVYRRIPLTAKAIALIVLVVLLANGMYVFGLANSDPISWTTGIAHHLCGLTCGRPAIDPNVGYVTQTLGHEAAMDLLHGHFPWWSYTQGLGQPLAGEMQSGALFPLTLLFALSSGLVWFHVSLEVIAGIATYFLARRLCLPVFVATFAAALFALNGTYAWIGNSVLNPVAFLPMVILGIEMVLDSASNSKNRGWYVLAIGLALSLYAGFPEVAYIDGLFALGWGVVRVLGVAPPLRARVLRRLGLGAVVGVLLALPILVPFADYLKVAFIGAHTASADGSLALPHFALAAFFDPYVYGTIFSNTNVGAMWEGIGGYFGATICALALAGLFGAKNRALRIFLGAWTLIAMAGTFNLLGLHRAWDLIPIVSRSSFSRYSAPGCELAIVVLAAFGLYDVTQNIRAKRLLSTTSVLMALVLLWCVYEARTYNVGQTFSSPDIHDVDVVLQFVPFVALFFLLAFTQLRLRVTPLLIALVVVVESLLLFVVPTTESPQKITIDSAPIAFLKKNEGQERFLDFALLYPNWGTYFGLNELSDADLPFPQNFKHFIETDLEPGLRPGNEFVVKGGRAGIIDLEHSVINHFAQYEDASVKYLLIPTKAPLLKGLIARGVTEVFHDSLAAIYQMPHPRPYFSTTSSSCTIRSTGDNDVTLHCPAATKLLRTELSMPGWSAVVNGKSVPITAVRHVYQEVSVPAGRSTVTYAFTPPHEEEALIAGVLGALFLVGSWINERRRFAPSREAANKNDRVGITPQE